MKVVDVPEQMLLFPLMLMDGVTVEVTDIVIAFELAVLVLAQVAFEVRIQVTTWPLVSVLLVKVAELVPAFDPSTCH